MRVCAIFIVALLVFSSGIAGAQDRVIEDRPLDVVRLLGSRLNALFSQAHDGRKAYVLGSPLTYCENKTGRIYVVPAGFVSDYASIPPKFRRLFSDNAKYSPAAILHDWLYAIGEPGEKYEADRVFYEAMAEYGVSQTERDRIWLAVYGFGKSGYRLDADWLFVDPETHVLLEPGPTKPARVPYVQSRNCDIYPRIIAQVRRSDAPVRVRTRGQSTRVFGIIELQPAS